MFYVYILKSQKEEGRFYIGCTNDLKRRLEEHNAGRSTHTNKYMPWTIGNSLKNTSKKQASDSAAGEPRKRTAEPCRTPTNHLNCHCEAPAEAIHLGAGVKEMDCFVGPASSSQ